MDRVPSMPFHIVGIGGTTYATRATTAQDRCYATFKNSQTPVLVDLGGESDLIASMTAAQVLTAMENYHDAAKAKGAVYTLCATVPPGTIPTWYSEGQNTERIALNNLIRASTHWDAVIDLDTVPESADPSNLTYFSDGVHPTAALAAIWADLIATELEGLGIV